MHKEWKISVNIFRLNWSISKGNYMDNDDVIDHCNINSIRAIAC